MRERKKERKKKKTLKERQKGIYNKNNNKE